MVIIPHLFKMLKRFFKIIYGKGINKGKGVRHLYLTIEFIRMLR